MNPKGILEDTPEDMTVTVEASLTLAALQACLAQRGQWLPIDPPNPHLATIGGILNANASGPRRLGYGTIREHLLGLKVALADGRIIHTGGKVVKNVAGDDLCKLFVGSQGTLGMLVEATFKVLPLPEAERFIGVRCDSLAHAACLLEAIQNSPLTPVILDLQNVSPATPRSRRREEADAPAQPTQPVSFLVLGLAGTREDVDWQLAKAAELGLSDAADLEYENIFWNASGLEPVRRFSVLPSRLPDVLRDLGTDEFVARAGNGVIYYRGGKLPPSVQLPMALMRRIKEAYDPSHVLPELPQLTS